MATQSDQSTQRTPNLASNSLGAAVDVQRERLLALRGQLLLERQRAVSPAVARALEMTEDYLFLALGYLGHVDELFPGECPPGDP
ncbi:MAG TPA: hypothetical protein VL595_20330 [Pseudonocardia sp.]|jgi:hypothetical protein|nr:hypothetical protein [Pseudonocardia sp.]